MKKILLLLSLVYSTGALADRLVIPRNQLIASGYVPVRKVRNIAPILTRVDFLTQIERNSLDWPLSISRNREVFGGNMHQFQNFSNPPYYHAGVDVLALHNEQVLAPVSGKISAGFYAYTDLPDGRSEKYVLSLKDVIDGKGVPPWGKRYFGIFITASDGTEFELHHIDSDNLPSEIMSKILAGQGEVERGDLLGYVVEWSHLFGLEYPYHHVHYNIISSTGIKINPYYLSKQVNDSHPPLLKGVYSVSASTTCNGDYVELLPEEKGILQRTEGYVIVVAEDRFNELDKLPKAPAVVTAEFGDSSAFSWDFSNSLVDSNGFQPDIRQVYLSHFCDDGKIAELSTSFDFYFKIPVPRCKRSTNLIFFPYVI